MNTLLRNAGGLLLAAAATAQSQAQTPRPNVIVIYNHDTLDVGRFGAPDLCTPNMDALDDPQWMYAAYVSTFDDYLGELRTFLAAQGLEENTIVAFQSDNGHSTEVRTFGGGGYCGDYCGSKFSLFEGGIRVPAVISWPGHLPQHAVRDQVAMNIDWFPTLVELCGLDATGLDVDGRSIVPLIRDDAPSPHKALHFDFEGQWAVRCGDWKLINNAIDVLPDDKNRTLEGLYLTNLRIDPTESQNLGEQYPGKVRELLELRRRYEASLERPARR